jgi:hypothetical protein
MTTYRVVIAPKGYGPDHAFANAFFLRTAEVDANSEHDAVFRAAIASGVGAYESGDFTVRSVEVVQPEPAPVARCEYAEGNDETMTMIECARNGCRLCAGELDLAGEDF